MTSRQYQFTWRNVPVGLEGLRSKRAEEVVEALEKVKRHLCHHGPEDELWRWCIDFVACAGGCDPRRPCGRDDLSAEIRNHSDELGNEAWAALKKVRRYLREHGVEDDTWWWCTEFVTYYAGHDRLS